MLSHRGIITISLAVLLGLITARAVFQYMATLKKDASANRPVAAREAAPPPPPRGFSDRIPAGMRAVSLRVDEVSGVSRDLRAGDRVDVLATSKLAGTSEGGMTWVVLESVEVLHVPPPRVEGGKRFQERSDDWAICLLVNPGQGAALAAAMKTASISLLARGTEADSEAVSAARAFVPHEGIKTVAGSSREQWELIPSGMRVVTVPAEDTDGICGLLRHGDRVDVIVSCKVSMFSSSGNLALGSQGQVTEERQHSRTLLQDVEVLASEKSVELGMETRSPVTRVSLLTSPADAEKLAAVLDSTSETKVRLIVRNRNDRGKTSTEGQVLTELLTERVELDRVTIYKGSKVFEERLLR